MSEAEPPKRPRPVSMARAPLRSRLAIVKGQDKGRFTDFYHAVLTSSWPVFFIQLAVVFIFVNLVFTFFYVADPQGITNAEPGSITDAFFFSVQVLGAGSGDMVPKDFYTDAVVSVESFFGILTIAIFAGLMYARFSQPVARVVFSNVAVVTLFDGVPTLMFRVANQRGNSILDASVTVSLARQYITQEGVEMRRFQELKLLRDYNPLFALSWTVMHQIDPDSPLYNLTPEQMAAQEMEIVIMLSGTDETIHDDLFARHAYWHDEILWQKRFVDVISLAPSGHRVLDLAHFHETLDA